MDKSKFCWLVGERVKEQYDVDDGSDLCYNLMSSDVVTIEMGVDEAARIVAQHMLQQ